MFNFFKRKQTEKTDLEKIERDGFITKEELLTLKVKRAEKELRDFLEKEKPKKNRK